MTLFVGLILIAPFVVLALRTTRWDPLEHWRRWTASRPRDVGARGEPDDDVRRVSIDLAAMSAHACC